MNIHLKSTEKVFNSHLQSIAVRSDGVGLIFNLSKLSILKENSEHITIAANILSDHLKGSSGEIYVFSNGDIIVYYQGANTKLIFESIYQLRYLFADDPLCYHRDGRENAEFCFTYFAQNWKEFINRCQDRAANTNIPQFIEPSQESLFEIITSNIENALAKVNWDKVVKNHPICLLTYGNKPRRVISHFNIDLESLRLELRESLEIVRNRNLFNFVREVIDLRLLITLLQDLRGQQNTAARYVNLSVATLESEEFRIFSEGISEQNKKNLVIGVHVSEVFRELSEFLRLKDTLVAEGFKLCLHGLDVQSFLMVDRSALGFDLLKLKWQPDVLKQDYDKFEAELKAKIQNTGVSRVIFGGCDSNNALGIGQRLGLSLYQGNLIDRMC